MWYAVMGTAENPEVVGDRGFPVDKGALCVKGWTSVETLAHPKPLLSPLTRNNSGQLVPVSWDEDLSRVTTAFQSTQSAHGKDAVGIFGGGSLTNEKPIY
jgi:assimilatory nitrate reductase catalytic subunit